MASTRRRALASFAATALAAGIPRLSRADRPALPRAGQLLLGLADDWSSTRATLYPFHRDASGAWAASLASSIPALLGRGGLAWGRGAVPVPQGAEGAAKREGDRKAPAGYFAIGKILGAEAALPQGSDPALAYRQVTRWDAWPDDPANPHYNQHLVIDPSRGVPDWFESQKMRVGDPAYHWLVEIRHNSDPKPVPGAGSAIFLHVRRGPDRLSHGCTVMRREDLETIVRWLRARALPHYVLLPRPEYLRLQAPWDLPQVSS